MKKQLALALVPVLLALVSFTAWASDGDIQMLAQVTGTGGGHIGDECTFWKIVYNNSGPNGKTPWGVCQPPTINVYAELKGASAGGITGAEYAGTFGATTAADPGYFFLEIPNPMATTVLGSAFFPPDPAPRGQNIVFDTCQDGLGTGRVLLATLIVIPTVPCGSTQLPPQINMSTVQHFLPSNVYFRCPLFTLCDAPAYTKVCLGDNITLCRTPVPPFPTASQCSTSGAFAINDPTSPGIGACQPPPGKTAAAATIESTTWGNVKGLYR